MSSDVNLERPGLWIKPLYYHLANDRLVISYSPRLVVSELSTFPQLNWDALDTYLALEFFPAPLTPFTSIWKVGVEESCTINLATGHIKYVTMSLDVRADIPVLDAVEKTRVH